MAAVHLFIDDEDSHLASYLNENLPTFLTSLPELEFHRHVVTLKDVHLSVGSSETLKAENLSDYELDTIEPHLIAHEVPAMMRMRLIDVEPLEPPKPRLSITWKDVFELLDELRVQFKIPVNDFCFLLTPKGNDKNWFSVFRSKPHPGAFVQTSDWSSFTYAPVVYPVAYLIWEMYLKYLLYGSLRKAIAVSHRRPMGCINDKIKDKKDIALKMRTADICPDCIHGIQNSDINPAVFQAALDAFERIQTQSRFLQPKIVRSKPSPISIDSKGAVIFDTYAEIKLILSPIEFTVYLFLLKKKDGVSLKTLSDFKAELEDIYEKAKRAEPESVKTVISHLTNPFSNSFSEKVSKINSKIRTCLTLENRYSHYVIQKEETKFIIKHMDYEVSICEYYKC